MRIKIVSKFHLCKWCSKNPTLCSKAKAFYSPEPCMRKIIECSDFVAFGGETEYKKLIELGRISEVNLTCPFCQETDFDEIGLKKHILFDCDAFRDVESIKEKELTKYINKPKGIL